MVTIRKDSEPGAVSGQLKSFVEEIGFNEAALLALFVVDKPVVAEFPSTQLMVESVIDILNAMTDANYLANVVKHPEQNMLVVGFKIIMPEDAFMVPGQMGTV